MPAPGEHKTVQARILAYAQEIGWTYVPREEAERRRGVAPHPTPLPASGEREMGERARNASLFFGDLLHTKVREFNPRYKEAEGALVGELQRLHSDIYGNRDFLTYLRNRRTFFSSDDDRELDLVRIDYGDLARSPNEWRNRYEVTEEISVHNGQHGTREDMVFLINGIPVLMIECKDATKDEAIAQVNRPYENESQEMGKPHGFVLDFVGIFDKLEKALAFDSDDPFLIAMAERAKAVQESFEDRQIGTEETLAGLLQAIERDEQRKREQVARGLDALPFFVFTTLREKEVPYAEDVAREVGGDATCFRRSHSLASWLTAQKAEWKNRASPCASA